MVDYFILVYKHITCLTYPWEQLKLLISMLRSHKVVRVFLFKLGRQNWSIIQWQVERPAKKNIYFTLYLSTAESRRQWYQVKGFISLNSLFFAIFFSQSWATKDMEKIFYLISPLDVFGNSRYKRTASFPICVPNWCKVINRTYWE